MTRQQKIEESVRRIRARAPFSRAAEIIDRMSGPLPIVKQVELEHLAGEVRAEFRRLLIEMAS